MPYKNKEDRRIQSRRWVAEKRASDPDFVKKEAERARKHYQKNKERITARRRKHRQENPEKYESEKKASAEALKQRKRELKARLVKFFGGECCRCGIKDEPCIYDFHHLGQKDSEISRLLARTRNWERLVAEASKCELVCSNCHRKIHFS